MLASALEDEETQDKGIVLLVWNLQRMSGGALSLSSSVTSSFSMASSNLFGGVTPPWGGFFFDSFWNLWKSIQSSFRIARLHYVTVVSGEDGTTYTVKETGPDKSIDKSTIIRHHTGSSQECLHALLTYGLPIASLPITPERIETTHHHKWVEWRQRTDSYHHQHQYQLILVPTRYDVLLGKHSPINAGNIRFHQMILANVMEYRQSKPAEQSAIRTQIYKTLTSPVLVSSPPGRSAQFLQPLDARLGILWEPMTETAATTKIAQAFQFVSRQIDQQLQLQQQQQQQGDASSTNNKDRENHVTGKKYWPSDLADLVWRKKCCFMIPCNKEGYHICNGDSQDGISSPQEW